MFIGWLLCTCVYRVAALYVHVCVQGGCIVHVFIGCLLCTCVYRVAVLYCTCVYVLTVYLEFSLYACDAGPLSGILFIVCSAN